MNRKKDTEFRFKRFSVQHDRSTMKVGTDAVLIGAWVDVTKSKHILEVGTGSGVIALMLAQRSGDESSIDAIEIDAESVLQAKENVSKSPWPEKITVHSTSFQNWNPKKKYDLIVSNPPFFSNSLLPPNSIRSGARHSISLTDEELLKQTKKLLSPDGRLALVLPFAEGNLFIEEAAAFGFHLLQQLAFFTRHDKPQERWLLEFAFKKYPVKTSTLTLYEKGNAQSKEYKQFTSDFYLAI